MITAPASSLECPRATAGEIAVLNLESSLQRYWYVLQRWPDRSGTAECIVEMEQHRAQFLGDATALDRLARLSFELCCSSPQSASGYLIAAQVASMLHRFSDSKAHLAKAEAHGAPADVLGRVWLTLKHALGDELAVVLEARRQTVEANGTLQDLVPLGAVLADLGEFDEADQTFARAIQQYRDVSPFALAWVCFQLGVLWGETVPTPDPDRAAHWYQRAVAYLPAYTHARVHLAEIHLGAGDLETAEALLLPVVASGDPEVRWRLAQVLAAQARSEEAKLQRDQAQSAFETLLARHELAFADHAAEFYLSTGANPSRACALARMNLANRPTLRAFELAHAAAAASGDNCFASELVVRARAQCGYTKAYTFSPLAKLSSFDSAPTT
jgi:tetratricopeptide (TPR) repeat protein